MMGEALRAVAAIGRPGYGHTLWPFFLLWPYSCDCSCTGRSGRTSSIAAGSSLGCGNPGGVHPWLTAGAMHLWGIPNTSWKELPKGEQDWDKIPPV